MNRQCTSCYHPVAESQPCPFCSGTDSVETCVTCGTIAVKPPGADESFCQLCVFESAVSK